MNERVQDRSAKRCLVSVGDKEDVNYLPADVACSSCAGERQRNKGQLHCSFYVDASFATYMNIFVVDIFRYTFLSHCVLVFGFLLHQETVS